MNKLLFTISMFALLLFSACANQNAVACTMDAKICPDGSAVGRMGPDCEFEECPAAAEGCNYDSTERSYVGKSADECSRIKFMCIEGTEYFADGCGCGCAPSGEPSFNEEGKKYISTTVEECKTIMFQCAEGTAFFDENGCGCQISQQEGKIKVTDCTPEQKAAQACTKEYMPVCGWSDPAKIQCIKYPCAQTFGNKCEACANENTISWSEGECPEG